MQRPTGNRGAALIVVLAVLVILTLLALTFNALSRLDQDVAKSYLTSVRARLVARAGVDHSLSILEVANLDNDISYVPQGTEPLEKADRPSFYQRDPATQAPTLIRIEGEDCGYTDMLEGSPTEKDVFSVFVRDANALINVNDGARFGATHSVSRNLRRILRVLGTVTGAPLPEMEAIVDLRPGRGYRSKYEVLTAMNNNREAFDRIKDFITVSAWEDTRVLEPVPLSRPALTGYPNDITYLRGAPGAAGVFRYGRNKGAGNKKTVSGDLTFYPLAPFGDERTEVYGLDELNPMWLEVTARAPINVNSAPKEVLVAVLADLQGFFLLERRKGNPTRAVSSKDPVTGDPKVDSALGHLGIQNKDHWAGHNMSYDLGGAETDDLGVLVATEKIQPPAGSLASTVVTGPNTALAVAGEIISCRERKGLYAKASFGGPFRNWTQFNAFCDNLVTIGVLQDTRPALNDALGSLQAQGAQALADALKANFNPNVHLNELNPDANLHLKVDKTDLIVHSTEFCFYPPGRFEIESLGRIVRPVDPSTTVKSGGDHKVVGESRVMAVVKLWDAYRETTQKQFTAGTLSGDDFTARIGREGTNSNKALEIGPEPNNGDGPSMNEWGGYIAFATVGGTGLQRPADSKATVATPSAGPAMGEWLRVPFQYDYDAHHHFKGDKYRLECSRSATEKVSKEEADWNYPDKTEINACGPYDVRHGGVGSMGGAVTFPPRLARHFETPEIGKTSSMSLLPVTGMDLRIDGAYSERHSAPTYLAMEGVKLSKTTVTTRENTTLQFGSCPPTFQRFSNESSSASNSKSGWEGFYGGRGTVSLWVKPAFEPEGSGKVRAFFDFSRYHYDQTCALGGHAKSPFGLWFLPMQGSAGVILSDPRSLLFAGSIPNDDKLRGEDYGQSYFSYGRLARTVNHLGVKPDEQTKASYLGAHRWMHVTMVWDVDNSEVPDPKAGAQMYVNGRAVEPGSKEQEGLALGDGRGENLMWYHDPMTRDTKTTTASKTVTRTLGYKQWETKTTTTTTKTVTVTPKWANTVRLGNPSQICDPSTGGQAVGKKDLPWAGNFSADATVDELYCWSFLNPRDPDPSKHRDEQGLRNLLPKGSKETADSNADTVYEHAMSLWKSGRYTPKGLASNNSWISPVLKLGASSARTLPRAGGGSIPSGAPAVSAPGMTLASSFPIVIRGLSYTWYGEETVTATAAAGGTPEQKRLLWNYAANYGDPMALGLANLSGRPLDQRPAAPLFLNAEVAIVADSTAVRTCLNDGFSRVEFGYDPAMTKVQYRVRFTAAGSTGTGVDPILLGTPVFDDITIYYSTGDSLFLEYSIINS